MTSTPLPASSHQAWAKTRPPSSVPGLDRSSGATLLVYYSRSDHTRRLAEKIAGQCDADIEEIVDSVRRRGLLGYLRSLFEALLHIPASIEPNRQSPRNYDTVIVGSPVWAGQVCSPVRSYLRRNRGRFRRIAFFCSHKGSGYRRVLQQMGTLSGRSAVATLALAEADLVQRRYGGAISRFSRAVNGARRSRSAAGLRDAA
jgi:flavodoxin